MQISFAVLCTYSLNTILLQLHRKLIELMNTHVLEGPYVGLCGLVSWKNFRKPENPGETTDFGQATATLPHAYILVAVLTSECFTTTLSRALNKHVVIHPKKSLRIIV